MAHVKDEGAKEEPDSKMEIETMSQIPEPAHALQLPLAITEENFKEVVLSACKHHLDLCGGPVQYLKKHLGPEANSKWSDFAEALSNAFPRRSDMSYLDDQILPRHLPEGQAFQMSLWQLGFLECCSSKPPTFKVTALLLLDEYVTNSFLTAGEPLLLYQQAQQLPTEMQLDDMTAPECFWTHYLKGAARASCILMLAHVILNVLKVDVAVLNPTLHQSMLAVHCRLGIAATDMTTIAMENAKFSARGSIRKSHDLITWAAKLKTLKDKGLQPSEIIKKFNQNCTKDAAIQGAKRVGLLLLLDLPPRPLQMLIDHVSQWGWDECAFTESSLSNKKLAPGFQPRTNNDKAWQKRLLITESGYELYVRYVGAAHARKTAKERSKFDTNSLTEALQMSQLVVSSLVEIQDQYAVPSDANDKIVDLFLSGSNSLELELQGSISELKKGWQPADITCFKELIATCIAKRDGTLESIGKGPKITAGQLEKQSFELLLSSLQHDVDSYSVWKAKCSDRDSALYFQRLNHQSQRHSRARDMAEAVFAKRKDWAGK